MQSGVRGVLPLAGLVALVVVLLALNFAIIYLGGTFHTVHSSTDRSRGVFTDNVVGLVAVACVLVYLKVFKKAKLEEVSIVVFVMQEIVNLMCDLGMRTTHLTSHFGMEEMRGRLLRLDDGSDEYELQILVDADTTPSPCFPRREMKRGDRIVVSVDGTQFEATYVGGDGNFYDALITTLPEGAASMRITFVKPPAFVGEAQCTFALVPKSFGASVSTLFGYLVSATAMRSAVVSCITIFTADVTMRALSSFVSPFERRVYPSLRRFLPVLTFWITNVLGCIPINSLRFGWAYATERDRTLDDALAALVYLLTGTIFLRLHSGDETDSMRIVDKGVVFVSGLFILALMSGFPDMRSECHERSGFTGSATDAALVIVLLLVVFIYVYLIYAQLENNRSRREFASAASAENDVWMIDGD